MLLLSAFFFYVLFHLLHSWCSPPAVSPSSMQPESWASSLPGALISSKCRVWWVCCLTLCWPEVPALLFMHAKSLQLCLTLQPHRLKPASLPCPWDSPCKNTGRDCHFLLQCMKVKSESEVAQTCPTLSDPMDCSLPGSSVHGSFQARVLEWALLC